VLLIPVPREENADKVREVFQLADAPVPELDLG